MDVIYLTSDYFPLQLCGLMFNVGHAIAEAASCWLPTQGHVRFVVDKAVLGQVLSEYFGSPCNSFYQVLHTHHHLSPRADTTGPNSGRCIKWTLPHPTSRNKMMFHVIVGVRYVA
jgi:hypothetical protein